KQMGWGCPHAVMVSGQLGMMITNFTQRTIRLPAGKWLGFAEGMGAGGFSGTPLQGKEPVTPPSEPTQRFAVPTGKYIPQYKYPVPTGIKIGDESTETSAQVDINPDLPEDERSRLQALIGHMGVC